MTCTIKREPCRYISVLRHFWFIAGFILLASTKVMAQYEVPFTHYWETGQYFNPAAAGSWNMLNITAAYTSDFTGSSPSPRAGLICADMPLDFLPGKSGAGVYMLNNKTGLYKHQRWAIQYVYRLKIARGTFSAGLQAGLAVEKLDTESNNSESSEATDNQQDNSLNGNATDFSAGIMYGHGDWYAGLSAQHINSPTVKLADEVDFKINPAYYFTAGYNIKLRNPFIKIKPSVLLRADNDEFRADISARTVYTNGKKELYGGLSYSPDNSVTVLAGGAYNGFRIGYSYERHTAGVAKGSGSHYFIAGYQVKLNLTKKNKHKHKSVRLL